MTWLVDHIEWTVPALVFLSVYLAAVAVLWPRQRSGVSPALAYAATHSPKHLRVD